MIWFIFLDSSCFSASDKVTATKDLTRPNKIEILHYEIGERLFYTNGGCTSVVRLADIIEDVGATQFVIKLPGNRLSQQHVSI